MQVKVKNACELKRYVSQNIRTIRSNSWNCTVNKFGVLANLYSARLCCIHFSLIVKLLYLNIVDRFQTNNTRTLTLTDFYTTVVWFHTLFFTYVSCCVSYLTLLMANIKNRKKLQLIQTIWDVTLYSQHFTFHWKLLGLVSRIEKSGTGDNNFGKWKGTFRSDRLKWPDRSQWTTFKAGPEYSGRTKPKWAVPFDVPTEITGIFGWMESALKTRLSESEAEAEG